MFLGLKKNFFVFAGIFLAMVLIVWAGYFIWDKYLSEGGKAQRLMEEQTRLYEAKERAYIEAMTADTYGGKTPQETLDLFVAALEKDDIELASKYFLLDTDASAENKKNYLTRNNIAATLQEVYQEGRFKEVAKEVSHSVLGPDQPSWDENMAWYVVYGNDGKIKVDISLRFNKYSQIWKIESL